jgi:hypothetical protein
MGAVMTRKYTTKLDRHPPVVEYEFVEPAPPPIAYHRGDVSVWLYGPNAGLYRGMIWMYGEEEATERFWWVWHKKNSISTPENAVSAQTSD